MKELSIEEKAKACDSNYKVYTELINRLEDVKEAIKKQNYGIAMDVLCKSYPEFQVTTHSELKESEDERIRKELLEYCRKQAEMYNTLLTAKEYSEVQSWIAWLEKQGNLMKCLQIANSKIGDLIEENYYLRENLEKQGNNMGISEATKQKLEDNLNNALEKETPESWNKFLDEQGEQNTTIEMITPEESLGINSDTYNKIVDECIYGEQKTIKKHNACEFCEDRYGCVSPCSMKLIEEQKPIEEYNITGIGSKHATGKLAEKIKEFDEKTKELKLLKQGEQKPFGQRDECLHCQFNYDGECKGFCAMKRSNRKPYKPADKVEPRQEELTEFEKAVKQVMEEAIECGDTHNLKADADMLLRLVQKSFWSEEDIELLNSTIKFIEDRVAATSPSLRTYNPTLTGKEIPFLKALKDRVQPQKQEWSDVDRDILFRTIDNLKFLKDTVSKDPYYTVNTIDVEREITWLKSIKDRVLPQPKQEWCEEDESRTITICTYLQDYARLSGSESRTIRINEYCDWLKSLRPQSQWKPSDEQMLAINTAINVLGKGTINGKYLIELQEQLKKLMEK